MRRFRWPEMQILKIGLSVFICLLISLGRGDDPQNNTFYACIAAIITLKSTIKDSWTSSILRVQCTLIGAFFGLLALELQVWTGIELRSVPYVSILALLVIVALWIAGILLRVEGVSLAGVVLLSVALNHASDAVPWMFALHRVGDTVVGVAIGLAVNHLFPSEVLWRFYRKKLRQFK